MALKEMGREYQNRLAGEMDSYEREKVETTLQGVEQLAAVIKNYLVMVDYCKEMGIHLPDRESLGNIRYPGALADPSGPLTQLAALFQNGMSQMAGNIDVSHKAELEERYVK